MTDRISTGIVEVGITGIVEVGIRGIVEVGNCPESHPMRSRFINKWQQITEIIFFIISKSFRVTIQRLNISFNPAPKPRGKKL
jgi:hypothetical protein